MNIYDLYDFFLAEGGLWSPLTFAVLAALAVALLWFAFAPARPVRKVRGRLHDYLKENDLSEGSDVRRPFASRVLLPALRSVLRFVGMLGPKRNVEAMQQMVLEAGEPAGMTALDFFGLQMLSIVLLGGGYFLLVGRMLPFGLALRNALILGLLGFLVPYLWLRSRVKRRKQEILRALPDALDMLTISVEAGLAFESAMLKVGERWHNALTEEFRRAVIEMRLGTHRDVALQRVADRAGVQELGNFVAILIQSGQLGVSIAQVLHAQADQMRIRRRQRAEELAREAGVKMVFALVFLIFPALLIVLLGPGLPGLFSTLAGMGGGSSPFP